MQITLDVPEHHLVDATPAELAARVKLYAAVLLFRSGQLSAGAATEFAGVDRYAFIQECAYHGVPMIDYSPEEFAAEVERLSDLLD